MKETFIHFICFMSNILQIFSHMPLILFACKFTKYLLGAIYHFTTLYKILNKISYCPQECLQHGAELTRKLAEAEEKVVATQDVVAICTETMGSLSEVVAMVDGDSVVICLAVYTALSLLWTVARLTHIWWTGPTGGRFHPDVIATWLFVTAIQYLWAQCKSRYVSCSTGETTSAAQSARVAKLRAYLSRNLTREGNTNTQEEETPSRTGLQGPSFHLVDMSGAVDANRDQVAQPTGPFVSVPTICLNARIEQWVEESADSGRNSAPTSALGSDPITASDSVSNENYYSAVNEEDAQSSTLCGTASGKSDLDAPLESATGLLSITNTQVSLMIVPV